MLLALDPSISSTGYCVIDNEDLSLLSFGKVTTKPKEEEDNRIFKIAHKVDELLNEYDIDVIVMEAQFLGRNVKTAMQLSRLRGSLIYVCKSHSKEIVHLMPSEVRKYLFHNGSASKEEVAKYIKDFYSSNEEVQELGEFNDRACKAKNSDIYDAISIGLSYSNKLSS